MYQYYDNTNVSLHDCRATKIVVEENVLSFVFNNGFNVLETNKYNDFHKTAYTDASEVKFAVLGKHVNSNTTIYIFTETDNANQQIREEISFEKFAEMINNGNELEFISSYSGYNEFVFVCWLWFNEFPYHKECVISIYAGDITYCWNNLFVDK